jgi:hypothetical protein
MGFWKVGLRRQVEYYLATMKRLYSTTKRLTSGWAKVLDFLLFLVTPEDTNDVSQWMEMRHRYACFDKWYFGAVKVIFLFGCSALLGGRIAVVAIAGLWELTRKSIGIV